MKKLIAITLLFLGLGLNAQQGSDTLRMFARMDGLLMLSDAHFTEYWGFGIFDGPTVTPQDKIKFPGPILKYNVGDTAIIKFFNDSPEDHSIHWHGLDVDQANDGVPTTSSAIDPQQSRTYTFVCAEPGTFNYHCHVLTTLHLAMGMYGSFVVYPDADRDHIYANGPSYTKEYIWLASELNRNWTDNPTSPGAFYLYEPTDFLLNGEANNQLSDVLINGNENDTIAMRLSNMGYGKVRYIFPQGANTEIHMSDGRVIPQTIFNDTVDLYSGERYTVLLNPDQDIDNQIKIEYYDLRNNQLMHVNFVDMKINDTYTSVDEVEPTTLEILGNPVANQQIVIRSEKAQQVNLYTLNGQLVKTLDLVKGLNVIPLPLDASIYFLQSEYNERLKIIVR